MASRNTASAGHQQPPGPAQHHQQEKALEGTVGQPRQNAQNVVGEKGEEEGQSQEHVPLPADEVQVLFRQPLADQLAHKPLAQGPGQGKHNGGAQDHRPPGEQEGGPQPEEVGPRGGGDVAGNRGDHHRRQLDGEVNQVGPGGAPGDVRAQPLLRARGLKKAGGIQRPQAAAQNGDGQRPEENLQRLVFHNASAFRSFLSMAIIAANREIATKVPFRNPEDFLKGRINSRSVPIRETKLPMFKQRPGLV